MRLLGRVRRGPDGTWCRCRVTTPGSALQTGEMADIYLPVQRTTDSRRADGSGSAVILGQGALETVSLGVDSRTFATIKGEGLDAAADGLAFRDGFVHLPGSIQCQLGDRGRRLRAVDSGLDNAGDQNHNARRLPGSDRRSAQHAVNEDSRAGRNAGGRGTSPETKRLVAELRDRDRAILERVQAITREETPYLPALRVANQRMMKIRPRSWKRWRWPAGDLVSLLINLSLKDWTRGAIDETGSEITLADEVERHVEFDEQQRRQLRESCPGPDLEWLRSPGVGSAPRPHPHRRAAENSRRRAAS